MTDQTDFTAAILDPDRAVPDGLCDPSGRPAGRRFSVYRNNVAVSLTEALETAFPVIAKLVGDDFFRAMAGAFLRQHPPASPLMMHYGQDMPGFLEMFEPVKSLPYLPDIARLEIAIRQSYHAADANPIDPAVLPSMPADQLMRARLRLAPATRLIRSEWPIHAIWAANMDGGPAPEMRAENVLITRAYFDPSPNRVDDATANFIDALMRGATLGDAIEAGGDTLDLPNAIGMLVAAQAITGIKTGEPQ